MDFANPKKLRILTICVLFRVLKRLEDRYRLSLSSFCSKHLTSNRCISGLPCPIAMQFLSSESTFQALHSIMTFEALKTTVKVEKQS